MKKILLIFTGGTICSCPNEENGKNQSKARQMASYLEENYKHSASPFREEVTFVRRFLPQDILSENMTVGSWNHLFEMFKEESLEKEYAGVIVLHGTDTLAYTSSLLSLVLSGIEIPVCMVSAQLDLKDPRTNGYDNFRASVELMMNGIAPNVYVVYRNLKNRDHEPGEMLVHYGAHLLQCPNHSDNFHSADEMTVSDLSNAKLAGCRFETKRGYLAELKQFAGGVMLIVPYTNLNYSNLCLNDVCAVVHGTYHSQSVCIGRAKDPDDKKRNLTLDEVLEADRPYSILSLLARCGEKGIPLLLAPCDANSFTYGTTANALASGAWAIPDTTLEAAFAKVVLGCSLGKRGADLKRFLLESVNREFVYAKREEKE